MSLLDTAREALKDLSISDIVRERLSLALDRLGEAERRNSELEKHIAKVEAHLEIEQANSARKQADFQQFRAEHEEEIRVVRAIEFRKGKRTAGEWLPFCPKCHVPAAPWENDRGAECSATCGWQINLHGVSFNWVCNGVE